MMHLKYPRKRGYLYWDELGCLARALGFHERLFLHHLPEGLMVGQLGIPIRTLLDAFDFYKTFHTALDRTYNIHTDEWNISVIKKALQLLDKHVFTFEEIQLIRITYQVYESADTRGLPLQEKILQRVIKMCDRMISPLKMMQRIKHMVQNFEEKDRIQLHELLDLLLWCELYQEAGIKAENQKNEKDERKLFKLDNFENMLTYYDQRLAARLNAKYIEEELKFTKEKFGSKALPKDMPPIDDQIRKKQVQYHKQRYQCLHEEIKDSSKRVNASRAGYVRSRPVSAPDVLMFQECDPSVVVSVADARPSSVREMFPHFIRPVTAASTLQDVQSEFPRPSVTEYQRPKTPDIVTDEEVCETYNKMNTLKFEMETIEMKYKQLLHEDLDCIIPGYRKRAVKKPQTPPPAPVVRKPKKQSRPSKDVINRLSNPHRKLMPTPSHAKTCDARFRGWYKVKTQRGPHFILVSTQFDHSPNGLMLAKLQKRKDEGVKKEPVLYRFTQRHQVACCDRRPWTSPAAMTSADLSTPAFESFPMSSAHSTGQLAKSESGSENVKPSETSHSDKASAKRSTDEELGPDSEEDWAEVAVFSGDGSPTSPRLKPSPASPDPSLIQTYLPPPKGAIKGNEFLKARHAKLEGIQELTEEEPDKSAELSTTALNPVPVSDTTVMSDKLPAKMPVVKIIMPEEGTHISEDVIADHGQPAQKEHSEKDEKSEDDEFFSPWFQSHNKASEYPWIKDIIKKDISQNKDRLDRCLNLSHLAHRHSQLLSSELKTRLK